jgi:sulfonate transport system substrate-binding protein
MPLKLNSLGSVLLSASLLLLPGTGRAAGSALPKTLRLDWAYYNPISLVLKKQGLIEEEFKKDGIAIEWVQSLGSNKALEFLRGSAVDFGSTAGLAALIGRANGNPIKAVYIYGQPEWTALVTSPGSTIKTPADLKGRKVAATKGTDPYVFLLRALSEAGLTEKDIELVPLQHPDGKIALERGSVDAWSGLDPYMAQLQVEKGYPLFFRKKEWNSYGFLNVREAFLAEYPEAVARVLKVYEKARKWTLANPDKARAILREEAKLSEPVAAKVWERNDFSDPALGRKHKDLLLAGGDLLKRNGVIAADADVPKAVNELVELRFSRELAAK